MWGRLCYESKKTTSAELSEKGSLLQYIGHLIESLRGHKPGQDPSSDWWKVHSTRPPLGADTTTCTPSPLTLDVLVRNTAPRHQIAARQHSAGLLLHIVIFISKPRVCVLINWCCASALAPREAQKAHFWYFQLLEWKADCFRRLQIPLSQEVHRMERQKESMASAYYEDLWLCSEGNWSLYGFCT